MAGAYYNEFDPYAAQWLRNLIAAGHIAPGDVDERSIVDVKPDDLAGYSQCHFFAGIGGWSLAARLAGWDDTSELWTGSCPCQPFSVAGKQAGQADERHLWPTFATLIGAQRPTVVMGEQVAAAVGKDWLDGVHSDLESIGYRVGAVVVPACAVDAPHRRDRLWFVADTARQRIDGSGVAGQRGRAEHSDGSGTDAVADPTRSRLAQRERDTGVPRSLGGEHQGKDAADDDRTLGDADRQRSRSRADHSPARHRDAAAADDSEVAMANSYQSGESQGWEQRGGQLGGAGSNSRSSAWVGAEWLAGADGKARRFEPSIRLLAHGVPARVGKLRAYGNAIVPQVAAEIIGAYMDARP